MISEFMIQNNLNLKNENRMQFNSVYSSFKINKFMIIIALLKL